MKYEELKNKYDIFKDVSEENVKKNWKRYTDKFYKIYNTHLAKKGRSPHIIYYVEEEEYFYMNKAFGGDECRSLITTDLILTNEELYCLLVVLFAPMGVFRGTYDAFLNYAELGVDKLDAVKKAIAALIEKGYMEINVDESTTEGYFTLISKRYIEKDCLPVSLARIRKVIAIAKINNTRTWIPIFKLWAAITTLNGSVSTSAQISFMTGLSESQVRYYGRMLKESGVFISEKRYAFNKKSIKCIGTEKTVSADWNWLKEDSEENC